MKTEISSYEQQAIDFMNATGATIETKFLEHGKHFQDDKHTRDIYEVKISKGGRKFVFKFGQSINCSGKYQLAEHLRSKILTDTLLTKYGSRYAFEVPLNEGNLRPEKDWFKNENHSAPTAYSILTCLTKSDPDTFENFCSEFGYDVDSRKAFKTYKAVRREWKNIERLFTPEQIEQLQEIN